MIGQLQAQVANGDTFLFSGRPRELGEAKPIPFRWPTNSQAANEYIQGWRDLATGILADLRLSVDTMKCIASHTSRREGLCSLTDKAIAARTGRSHRSTKRDILRLKKLGLIMAEYRPGDGHQERVRLLKIAVPEVRRWGQRIPPGNNGEVGPTYPPYVGPLDKGERRDV